MCGRYEITPLIRAHLLSFILTGKINDAIRLAINPPPKGPTIVPTKVAPIVIMAEDRPTVVEAVWGWKVAWMKKGVINARSEPEGFKPMFVTALKTRRCLLPATGWVEWTPRPGHKYKQPWRLDRGGELFAIAGLWQEGVVDGGQGVIRYTMMMRPALPELSDIHDRMPVVLDPAEYGTWLHDAGEDGRAVLDRNTVPDGWQKTKLAPNEEPEGPPKSDPQGTLF